MTKASKILTVIVTAASLFFMGAVAVSRLSHVDAKTRAADYPDKIKAQKDELDKLDAEIARVERRLKDALAVDPVDRQALAARIEALRSQVEQDSARVNELSAEATQLAEKVEEKRQEAQLRRNETVALTTQLDELRAQYTAMEAERRLLTDRLYQETGVLERAERRSRLLRSDGAPTQYDPQAAEDGPNTAAARPKP